MSDKKKLTGKETLAALAVAFELKANDFCDDAITMAMQAARFEALAEIVEEDEALEMLEKFQADGIVKFEDGKAEVADTIVQTNSKGGKA